VLILPPGHAQAITARRRLSRREQWMVGGVLATVAAVILVLVISLATTGRSSAHGCIYATIPGAVGAQEIYQCGNEARATCASAETAGAFSAQSAQTIALECRKAGLPVGR
jgi:hypothetical protein